MIRSLRPEVDLGNVVGWSVYYADGKVFRRKDGLKLSALPRTGCQGTVVFCQGDAGLGQSPRKVYRETDYGCGADVVVYHLPGSTLDLRASYMIDSAHFETIRQAMDEDWEF